MNKETLQTDGLTAYTDGACRVSNPGLCSCAFVIYRGGTEVAKSGLFLGMGHTNNYAEYLGVITALEWARDHGSVSLSIFCDSSLIVNQINGAFAARANLLELCDTTRLLMYETGSTIQHVRGHAGIPGNEAADAECNRLLDEVQGK